MSKKKEAILLCRLLGVKTTLEEIEGMSETELLAFVDFLHDQMQEAAVA